MFRFLKKLFQQRPQFVFYQDDIWARIALDLDAKSIVRLGLTCKWFHNLMTSDYVWKPVCLRDLLVEEYSGQVEYPWIKLYQSSFHGSSSLSILEIRNHIDSKRHGAILVSSSELLVMLHKLVPTIDADNMTQGCRILEDVKPGIWLVDVHTIKCFYCERIRGCTDNLTILDARHFDINLSQDISSYSVLDFYTLWNDDNGLVELVAGIFDMANIDDESSKAVLEVDTWLKEDDYTPKVALGDYGVAVGAKMKDGKKAIISYFVKRSVEWKPVAVKVLHRPV